MQCDVSINSFPWAHGSQADISRLISDSLEHVAEFQWVGCWWQWCMPEVYTVFQLSSPPATTQEATCQNKRATKLKGKSLLIHSGLCKNRHTNTCGVKPLRSQDLFVAAACFSLYWLIIRLYPNSRTSTKMEENLRTWVVSPPDHVKLIIQTMVFSHINSFTYSRKIY